MPGSEKSEIPKEFMSLRTGIELAVLVVVSSERSNYGILVFKQRFPDEREKEKKKYPTSRSKNDKEKRNWTVMPAASSPR